MEAVVALMLVALPLVGGLARRWPAVALPVVAWPLLYLGLHRGWWGHGLGDGWAYAALGLWVLGVAATAAAIVVARAARGEPR